MKILIDFGSGNSGIAKLLRLTRAVDVIARGEEAHDIIQAQTMLQEFASTVVTAVGKSQEELQVPTPRRWT